MRRRAFVGTAASLGVIGLAGCVSDGAGTTPTATDTDKPPTIDASSIETTGTDCANGTGGVDGLDADASNHRLTVRGTVEAPDPCHLAELTETDLAVGTLSVTVGTVPDDQDVCVECVGAIDYEAVVHLTDGLTAEVRITHEAPGGVTEVKRETVAL
jgi:hypothetical protein